MTSPPDAAAMQRLREALEAHRGDNAAYRRLGTQLRDRRPLLDPRYANRSLFARELLVPLGMKVSAAYKLADQAERGFGQDRQGTSVASMLAVAEAYQVSLNEIAAVLDDPAATFTAPARSPSAPVPRSEPPGGDGWLALALSPDQITAARPYVDEIYAGIRDWNVRYARQHPDVDPGRFPEPSGADLFGEETPDAQTWDLRADLMPQEERVWLIATLRSRQARARRRESGTG